MMTLSETEIAILIAAADIAERSHRHWKTSRGKRNDKNDSGPLARELRTMVINARRRNASLSGES